MGEVSKKFTTQFYEAIYQVDEDQTGLRLDQFCALYLSSFSRQQIKKKIMAGEIKIFDRPYPHKPSVKVYENEKIQFITYREDLEDEFWRGEKLPLEFNPTIIYEDEQIMAISKPAYMSTHPTGKHLFNCATVFFEEKYGHTIHSIHRLDRETSGVLLLGKNPKAAQRCTEFFEKDLVKKCYFFIAHINNAPHFPFTAHERMGSLDGFIPSLYVHCFDKDSDQGKHAETHYKLLHQEGNYILGLAFPKTGRQHQIRTHAAHHGFPLVGDKLYNGDPTIFMRFKDGVATQEDHDKMQLSRHALHATALYLPYKTTEQLYTLFRAPIPSDFKDWIANNLPQCDLKKIELETDTLIKDFFQMM